MGSPAGASADDRSEGDASDHERALLRAAVTEAHERALASSRAKSEFLATMSHEMRTPLNAVVGYAELLDLEVPGSLNQAQHDYIERIREASTRLLALITDVLDLAKLDAGRLVLEKKKSAALVVVSAALENVEALAAERGVKVTVQNDGDPDFVADPGRVQQIVSQLVSNAVRFSDRGDEVIVRASTFGAPDADNVAGDSSTCWCAIRVEDSGIGIGERDLDAIFQPFTQLDSSLTRPEEGTGLGLTIVRRLARLMGGDLTVTSRLAEGSVFTLWLPAPPALAAGGSGGSCAARERRTATRSARGLIDVAEAIFADLEGLVEDYVERLRSDPQVAGVAAPLERHVLEDHVASFLTDIAQSLVVIERSKGDPAPLMRDATDIQLMIADRHGAFRQRTGWTEAELEREHEILLAAIEDAVRTALPPTAGVPVDSIEAGLVLVRRFVERACEQGRRGYRRAAIGTEPDISTANESTATAGTASTSTRLS